MSRAGSASEPTPTPAGYPPAPWRLNGRALCLPRRLEVGRADAWLPRSAHPLPVPGGRTPGGLYLARYEQGSTLRYHELIVVPALVRRGHRVGAWVSHIYVDDERSAAGGREIWGLPKQLAEFRWDGPGDRVEVRAGGRLLCAVRAPPGSLGLPVPVLFPGFGERDGLLWFRGAGRARAALTRAELEIPPDSPFAPLGLGPGPALRLDRLRLRVAAPVRAGR